MAVSPGPGSFTLFSLLPPELRHHIWAISSCPRIVCLKEYPCDESLEVRSPGVQCHSVPFRCRPRLSIDSVHTYGEGILFAYKSQCRLPVIFSVCQESRMVAQTLYTKAFGTSDTPAETWFDFQKDTLYIDFDMCRHEDSIFYKRLAKDIRKVKKLAITDNWHLLDWRISQYVSQPLFFVLPNFVNVETITLVDGQHWVHPTADLSRIEAADLLKLQPRCSRQEAFPRQNRYHFRLEQDPDDCRRALYRDGPDTTPKMFPELKFEIWIGRPEGAITVDQEDRREGQQEQPREITGWRKMKRVLRQMICR